MIVIVVASQEVVIALPGEPRFGVDSGLTGCRRGDAAIATQCPV
jgi:hypothetical protein